MLSKLNAHKNQKGFTLIELLIVIAIIGILAAVAIPQFSAYRDRANGAAAQSDLHNVYLSCKAFWGDNTPATACTEVLIGGVLYGFVSSNNVTLAFTNGTEAAFAVSAVHASTPTITYAVNAAGAITSGATP